MARTTSIGMYLTDEIHDVLLPKAGIPDGVKVGDIVTAFVYLDSEDRPIATLRRPKAEVGDIASLYVVAVESVGVFLNWGLERDLLLPYGELNSKPDVGRRLLVRVTLDEKTNRPIATEKIAKYLEETCPLPVNEAVKAIVWRRLDNATFLIVDSKYRAIAAPGQFVDQPVGTEIDAFVVRSFEGQITLGQRPVGIDGIDKIAQDIIQRAKREGGFLGLSDKSDPAEIRRVLGISKGDYKKAIGMLMKKGILDIEFHGIRLKPSSSN